MSFQSSSFVRTFIRVLLLSITFCCMEPDALADVRKSKATRKQPAKAISQENEEKYNAYYLESVVEREKGNFTAQYQLLKRALEIKPTASEALFDLARAGQQGEVMSDEEIERLFNLAVKYSPEENTYYLETLGQFEMTIGQFDKAIPIFKRLTGNELKRAKAFQMLLRIFDQKQDYDSLLATLDDWQKAEGETEEMQNIRMKTYNQMKRYDDAIEIAGKLALEDPDNDYYPIAQAEIQLQKGDTTAAWKTYEQSLQQNPSSLSAQMFKVYYFQTLKKEPQLLDACEELILNNEQSTELRVSMLQSLISTQKSTNGEQRIRRIFQELMKQPLASKQLPELYGQYLAANNAPDSAFIPCMNKILEIEPANDRARLMLIQDNLNNRAYAEAAEKCMEGIRYNPNKLLFYQIGGGTLYQLKRYDESLEMFRQGLPCARATKDKEMLSNFYSSYADALHHAGKKEEAYALYDSAMVYNPTNVVTLNNYAYFLSLDGERLDKARQMSEQVLKYEPDNPTYIDTYAWILFVTHDYEQARAYIERALELVSNDPEDASLYEHAGDIYIQLGRKKEARQAWMKARDLGNTSPLLQKKIKKNKYFPQ